MPSFSASDRASLVRLSWSSSLSPSSAIRGVVASRTVSLTVLVRPPPILPSISDRFSKPTLPPPGMSSPWIGEALSARDTSISLSSSSRRAASS